MRKKLLYILALCSSLSVYSQKDIIEYKSAPPTSINEACKGFILQPDFSFKATSTSSMTFRVNTAACSVAETKTNISADQNYIVTLTPLGQTQSVSYKDKTITVDRTIEGDVDVLTQIQYFDGLGRPVQTIELGATPGKKDMLHLQEYDAFGRQSKTWLPLNSGVNTGEYRNPAAIINRSNTEYEDSRAFSEPEYEASPLNRVLKQYGPGDKWTKNPVTIEYLTNTSSGDLACVNYISGDNRNAVEISKSGNYANAQLYVTKMTDEDGNISYEFKDKLGQVILTRQMNGSAHDTYYVYDSFGNLKAVFPPMASDAINAKESELIAGSSVRVNLAYLYQYDARNRCIAKKLPGADWIHYVYDKADRLIFTQDGEQRLKGEWLFTIPDVFGRIVLTGTCKTVNNATITTGRFDSNLIKAEYSASGTYNGYNLKVDNTALPLGTFTVLTANYYDNYDYLSLTDIKDKALGYTTQSGYGTKYDNSKGLLTGSMTALLDGSSSPKYLYTAVYYDYKGNVIQSKSTNHQDGLESEYIAYTFAGSPTKKMHVHSTKVNNVTTQQTELYTYAYDHAGRLTTTKHKLNTGAEIVLAQNTYNELGQLQATTANNQANLKTSYTYNIRSWTNNITNPHFVENLTYTYNGNISTQEWKQAYKTRKYTFAYDKLSRIEEAKYTGDGNLSTSYTYDKMGNITSLTRYGVTADGVNDQIIDKLTLNYDGTGNQLKYITDAGPNVNLSTSADFKDYSKVTTAEYAFNLNGAMTKDLNKGIQGIAYNSLNLPRELVISHATARAKNYYTYTATGVKLQVKHLNDPTLKEQPVLGSTGTDGKMKGPTTDYLGNKIYEDGVLKMILTDNGYIESGIYYFYIKDHLGNNRIVANASGASVQSTQYYPFGMAFADGNKAELDKQPFKYNGKELDRNHELNWYDYSARFVDNAIGRTPTQDPLSEKFYNWSPYVYCYNNPMKFIDPDGKQGILTTSTPISLSWEAFSRTYDKATMPSSIKQTIFAVGNPISAWSIGEYKEGSGNISTTAGNFGINLTRAMGERVPGEGNYNNALRHGIWQAIITKEYNTDFATKAGNVHEYNPQAKLGVQTFRNIESADQAIDLSNNIIGRDIGKKNPTATNVELAGMILKTFLKDGMWTATQLENGNVTIQRTKLTEDQYTRAKERLDGLNENGLTR
ncbi:RHS repeat-associated protein [Dysgonomonas alginatilytica]|uniref:RHS repeat-associated protein n=1 Tax=Dysgonomonas alginatilytica TaxID=1605892 RepID=A0A2V3PKI6_9BACT|nr:DUF6443 domain-containing protein [Dysgonomonas alginatilytica]PXV59424.1 RHS repeat-associated protein [Dysgonomonas alginatilytica]